MQSETLLYESIRGQLVQQICSGELAVSSMVPTVKELQDRYHVSHITILHVLKDLRGMGLIEHCGRRYRICRRVSVVGSPDQDSSLELPVGICVRPARPTSYDDYFNEINLAIENELCLAHKYYMRSPVASVFNYQLQFSDEQCQELLRVLLTLDGRCCGTLVDERMPDEVLSEFLAQKHRPVVLVNRATSLPISSVSIMAEESAQLLWQKARQLGYTDIVMHSMGRLKAYNERSFGLAVQALDGSGEFSDLRLHLIENDEDEGWVMQEMMRQYAKLANQGKVLFLFRNNEQAYAFMGLMKGRGAIYGRDYGVCGFYRTSENDGYAEQLTTVQVDTDFMGRVAVRNLLNLCAHPWKEDVSRTACTQKLIFGETM